MASAFVQGLSGIQGSGFSLGPTTTCTATGGAWPSSTLNGDLLLCLCFAQANNAGGGGGGIPSPPTISAPVTSGVTWVLAGTVNTSGFAGTTGVSVTIALYYAANAPPVSSGITTSFIANVSPSVLHLENFYHLYELSGLSGAIDTSASNTGISPSPPSTSPLTTSVEDFIIVLTLDGALNGEASFGVGYTGLFGPVSFEQYILNEAAGTIATAFGSASIAPWCCLAVAFDVTPVTPTVVSVTPNNGPTVGGTSVSISGTNFIPGATVDFGGSAATGVVVVSPTTILCTTPAHALGAVTVSVSTSGGTGSLPNGYTYTTYVPLPTVIRVTPDFGPIAGGTAVVVTGTNFDPSATVDFGGSAASSVVFISSSSLTCVTPAHAVGSVTVSVTTTNGTGSLPNGYDYTSGGGGGTPVGFTPTYPPILKQPFSQWGLEADRQDSIAVDGSKRSALNVLSEVTMLTFADVPLSDLPAWKAFMEFALTGGIFTYRPLPDYPNLTSSNPMFQYPGPDSGDDASGYSTVQLASTNWTAKFSSFEDFSLELKLRLVADL